MQDQHHQPSKPHKHSYVNAISLSKYGSLAHKVFPRPEEQR